MEYLPFPALLLSDYNDIEEYGEARVCRDDNGLDFSGDFVPLIPLGAAASIDWVLADRSVARYNGTVYLSSKTSMRLVNVEPGLIENTRVIMASNVHIPATIQDGAAPPEKAAPMVAEIVFLSMEYVKLRTSTHVPETEMLYLSAEAPFLTLVGLPLKVCQRVAMQNSETLLLCETRKMNEHNYVALATYVARLEKNERQNEE